MDDFQFLLDYYEQIPLFLKLIWGAVALLFLIVLFLIIYLKVLRTTLRKNEGVVLKYTEEYEAILVNYLFAGEEGESISSEQRFIINFIKTVIKNPFRRKIVLTILLKLRNEISGEMGDLIETLYCESGLKNYALSKLKNRNWYIVAKGIGELTQFRVKDAHDAIVKHVYHKRREVRKEVQLYLVHLFRFNGLKFLDDLKTQLSEWDQIQILEVLQKFENQEIPDIKGWLNSPNDSVVIFTLKIVKNYNLTEVNDLLIALLAHKNIQVRINAIEILDHLYVFEAKDVLKKNFNERSIEEQILFFRMLENFADDSDKEFVIKHVQHENFEIKLSALKILKVLNIDMLKSIKIAGADESLVKIVEFVKNN